MSFLKGIKSLCGAVGLGKMSNKQFNKFVSRTSRQKDKQFGFSEIKGAKSLKRFNSYEKFHNDKRIDL